MTVLWTLIGLGVFGFCVLMLGWGLGYNYARIESAERECELAADNYALRRYVAEAANVPLREVAPLTMTERVALSDIEDQW